MDLLRAVRGGARQGRVWDDVCGRHGERRRGGRETEFLGAVQHEMVPRLRACYFSKDENSTSRGGSCSSAN
jgi:hypothetical protein